MASRLLKMAQSQFTALKSAFTPTRPTPDWKISPFPELDSHLQQLYSSLKLNLAKIRTTVVAPDYPEYDESTFIGSGVCVDPTLVVTTAFVVGRIRRSQTIGGYNFKAYIGSTSAYTFDGPVKLKPVAVCFSSDIAVLKVVEEESEQTLLRACPMAASPPERENLLMGVSCIVEKEAWWAGIANVRAVGQKTIPVKAPWPLKDELGWIEHDWGFFNRGPVPPSSFLYNCKEKVSGSISELSGSPWFNLHGELVGIASWELRDDEASFSVGNVAPMSSIGPVLDYAKTKGPDDPVVMDRWIDSVVIADDQHG